MNKIAWYGWRKDNPDFRDCRMALTLPGDRPLPRKKLNISYMPQVWDQGSAGSCVGHSLACACKYDLQRQGAQNVFDPSRLFLYYNARAIAGGENSDGGAQIRDGIKGVSHFGFCNEQTWGYDIDKVTDKPSDDAYDEGKKHLAIKYARVPQSLESLLSCLASGYVIAFGFSVYEGFESDEVARTGILPMPKSHEANVGGHAVITWGFDQDYELPWGTRGVFYVRNSWGPEFGLEGNFLMPFDYILNPDLASDFWNIQMVQA